MREPEPLAQPWTLGRLPLSQIVQLERNPKSHDLGAIGSSIAEFGFVETIVVNVRTGHLVHGHGRDDALVDLQKHPRPLKVAHPTYPNVPAGITIAIEDGTWLVPVFFVDAPADREEAMTIALNRTTELGGWNEPMLIQVLSNLAMRDTDMLQATGYDADDLDYLIATHTPPDLAALAAKAGQSQPSDFWPRISVQVSPETMEHYQSLLGQAPGENESQKLTAIFEAVDVSVWEVT